MGGMKDFAKLVVQQTATAKAINEIKSDVAKVKEAHEEYKNPTPAPPPAPVVATPATPPPPPTTPLVPPPPGATPGRLKVHPTLTTPPGTPKRPVISLTPQQQQAVAGVSDRPRLRVSPPEPRPAPTPFVRPTIKVERGTRPTPAPPAPRVLTPQQQQAIEGVKKMKADRSASTPPPASKPAKTRAQRRAMGSEAIARIRESLSEQNTPDFLK